MNKQTQNDLIKQTNKAIRASVFIGIAMLVLSLSLIAFLVKTQLMEQPGSYAAPSVCGLDTVDCPTVQ